MKKVIFFIVAVFVMCSCSNQEKIQNEVNVALEQYDQFAKECVTEHAKEDANEIAKLLKKHKHRPNQEKFNKVVENDANLILSKCFDNLFDKYGETKVINSVKTFASTLTYKDVEFNSKDEFYKKCREGIKLSYLNTLASNLEFKVLEAQSELAKVRADRIMRQLGNY